MLLFLLHAYVTVLVPLVGWLFASQVGYVTLATSASHLTGTVDAAFYLGDRTRLFVQVGEGKPLVVETSARRDFRHGEAVALEIDPRGLMAL